MIFCILKCKTREENCPMCSNHCFKDNLSCKRGYEYFQKEKQNDEEKPKTIQEQVLMELRKCGHFLHHNKDIHLQDYFKNLNESELKKMHELLSKIV